MRYVLGTRSPVSLLKSAFRSTHILSASLLLKALLAALLITTQSVNSAERVRLAQLEQRVQTLFARVIPAVVVIDDCVGVIVSEQGHVLMPPGSTAGALEVRLSNGRRLQASALGSSREWGVALARLHGAGPWPHIALDCEASVRTGQPITTITFPLADTQSVTQPLLDLEWVNRATAGVWFMRPDGRRYEWQMRGTLAFDLDGRLLGIENSTFPNHGTVFTHMTRICALWDDLVAGKNLDRERLSTLAEGHKPRDVGAANPAEVTKEGEAQATAASVRIFYDRPGRTNSSVSGTVITKDGMVATCGHHFVMPGNKVRVSFPNGRDLAGVVVGHGWPADIGVIQITDPGPFPFAEVGDSTQTQSGDPCLLIGYGPVSQKERQPSVRSSVLVESNTREWSYLLSSDSRARTVGGDSGGGLFDAHGRLIAFSPYGKPPPGTPNQHVRVEVLRAQAALLSAPYKWSEASPLAATNDELDGVCPTASIVEVLDGVMPVALGTIVASNGLILTISSGLPAAPICRLADGKRLPAVVHRVMRAEGLALLKVDAANLKTVQWSDVPMMKVGSIVGLAAPKSLRCIVTHQPLAFPGERGRLGVEFSENTDVPEVLKLTDDSMLPTGAVFGFRTQQMMVGDVVTMLENQPTPTLKELRRLLDPTGSPVAVAGDQVRVEVIRAGKQTTVTQHLISPDSWPLDGQSPRRSGFASVFGVAVSPGPAILGGPVFDASGKVVGVAVAAREQGWVLAVPAAVARRTVVDS